METERIVIPGKAGDAPWEGCINSRNYRIERGVPVEVPKELAVLIRRAAAEKRRSELRLGRFTSADGMKL